MSTGMLFVYGGIAGLVATVLLGIILFVVLRRKKRRLDEESREQYQS